LLFTSGFALFVSVSVRRTNRETSRPRTLTATGNGNDKVQLGGIYDRRRQMRKDDGPVIAWRGKPDAEDGDVVTIEPWRAASFPVIKDLMVDRSAFDRIIASGGFVSVRTGNAPDANAVPVAKPSADLAMDAAACIGCGACVAACPNASAMLFVAAKASHLNLLPQGQPERSRRALAMVDRMDSEGFGGCSNHAECEAACPKEIGVHFIAMLNRDFLRASLFSRAGQAASGESP